MRATDDPLERWLYRSESRTNRKFAAVQLHATQIALEKLETYLRQPDRKTSLYGLGLPDYVHPGLLPRAEVAWAEKLYGPLYQTGGNGSTYAQESLLSLIAGSRYPASIPFWLELLDLSRPRDSFSTQRRTWALAALAYLALGGFTEAETALAQAAHHPNPDVRALAIYYWGRLYPIANRELPPVARTFQQIAVADTAFGPRFQARQFLRQRALPMPQDSPGGVYSFKICFRHAKAFFSRTLELCAEATLEDLHRAIQRALAWGDDHLYSFFLNNVEYDELYRFSCPFQEDSPPWTHEAVLGELGLTRRHTFLYLFDYGDHHLFEIKVVDIQALALPNVSYPRVTGGRGDAPPQYESYGE